MNSQDGLDPKDLDDLIGRLSRRKQESPSAQIPFQDVKDILQDEGLLESLLKEHVSSRSPALPVASTANGGSVTFDLGTATLQGCDRVGKAVKCSVNLVSKVDRNVTVDKCSNNSKTRIFDPQGVEHNANVIEFGKDVNPYACTLQAAMIKDVPAKVTLIFNNLAPETKSVKALEISIATPGDRGDTEWQSAQFRDIAIK
jgi:hypothetical protein